MTAPTSRLFKRVTFFSRIGIGVLAVSAMALIGVPTAASAVAANYSNSTPVAIPDAAGGDCNTNTSDGLATSTITVPASGTIVSVEVGLNISHSWQSDLIVDLTSPAGTTIRLVDRVQRTSNCGSSADNIIANLSDTAGSSIEGYGAAGASYTPMQALSAFVGQNAAGNWKLSVYDVSTDDTGTLNSWSLAIDTGSRFSVANTSASEHAAAATFTVTRAGSATGTETVDYATADGTAVAGQDYTATSGTLTFAPGQLTQTVAVPLIDDTVHEGDETFALELSNPQGTPTPHIQTATAVATIVDDDARPVISISGATASEGDALATVTVTRTGALGASDSVDYATADDTATAAADYVSTSGTLVFAPGAATATITVPLIDDTLHEGDETFSVGLANPASSTGIAPTIGTGDATVTLTDDDARADLTISNVTVSDTAGSAVLTVKRSGALGGNDSVDFATRSGTARAGTHFTRASGTLVFAPGAATATITVPITDGAVHGTKRTFAVELSNPQGDPAPTVSRASASVTITDAAPAVIKLPLTGAGYGMLSGIALLVAAAGAVLLLMRARRTVR